MPLVGIALKSKMKSSIQSGLAREFGSVASTSGYANISTEQWEKIANAISDIALDIVLAITTEAQVNPGQVTAGGPTTQVTTTPGTIS